MFDSFIFAWIISVCAIGSLLLKAFEIYLGDEERIDLWKNIYKLEKRLEALEKNKKKDE
jgi:uncharacterized membrane protein